jgi:F-type H+-transporting ATPase subunit a
MATEQAPEQAGGAAEYIGHHLTFATHQFGGFTVNVDTVIVSILLGFVGLGFIWWAARGATSGVPSKRQAFIELTFDFIDKQVQDIFHGDRHRFVAPLALTVFIWVILMNAMDFLPADIVGKIPEVAGAHHGFRIVPTADTNTTFALALTVWALMIGFAMKEKGVGGFLHELFTAPFGVGPWYAAPLMFFINFLFNVVEYVSKPLSHSLRLFGNMYAGEIIYLLLWLLAGAGVVAGVSAVALGLVWSIFHILIVVLQAYIFMMLTVVYVQMAHEGH